MFLSSGVVCVVFYLW